MSATGRSDVRRKDDHYVTPAWCVEALWPVLGAFGTCLDPCAGEGRILLTLQERASSPVYRGIEIDEERATICATQNGIGCVVGDALTVRGRECSDPWTVPGTYQPYDLIVMNPPYSLALEFVQAALASKAKEVAVLLRLNFLGSQERAKFWRENPCDVYVLPKRPSFAVFLSCKKAPAEIVHGPCGWSESYPVGAELPSKCPGCGNPKLTKCSSDATEYAWFHWKGWRGGCSQGRGHWEVLRVP